MSKWCIGFGPEQAGPSKKLRHSSVLGSANCYLCRLSSPRSSKAGGTIMAGSEMKGAQGLGCKGKRILVVFWAVVPALFLAK